MNLFYRILIIWRALRLSVSSFAKNVKPESLLTAYIPNFINYINWSVSTDDKFTIAVLNNDLMYEAFVGTFFNAVVLVKKIQIIIFKKFDMHATYITLNVLKLDTGFIKEVFHYKLHGLLLVGYTYGKKNNSRSLNLARSLK